MAYIPRLIDDELDRYLRAFGATLIEGPKWCGKTTTAMHRASSSLLIADPRDDFAMRKIASVNPSAAISGRVPRLIDEWQEVPKLWDAVRFECDARGGKPGQFILTGSATPRDDRGPMHSGAGRVGRLKMGTLTLSESGVSDGSASLSAMLSGERFGGVGSLSLASIAELVVRGGWPATIELPTSTAMLRAREYVEVVCYEDVSAVDGVRRDPARVRSLIRSLARNESTLASNNTLVRDMGIDASRQTVSSYLDVLGRLNFTDDIPAWDPALRSPVPLRVSAKRHLADTSLAAAALAADVDSLVTDVKTLGLLFESLVLHDLKVYAMACGASLGHYHDAEGLEADAIVSTPGGGWAAFEVKLGKGQVEEAAANLARVETKLVAAGERPASVKCVVVGFGEPAYVTDNGVQVVPVDLLGA